MRKLTPQDYANHLVGAWERWREVCLREGCTEEEISPCWTDNEHFIVRSWSAPYAGIQLFHINERVGGNLVDEFLVFPDGKVYSTEGQEFI